MSSLKEKMLLWLPQMLIPLIGFLPIVATALFDSLGLGKLVENQSPVLLAKVALWLFGLVLWLFAYILAKRPKYRFFPELGVKAIFEKGLFLCPKCNHPMRIEEKSLSCASCNIEIIPPNKEHAYFIRGKFNKDVYL